MKTPRGESIFYFVRNAKQAKRLEDAINDFPLTLEIDSFSDSFKPPILISGEDPIIIQPTQGRFNHKKTKYGKGVKKVKKDGEVFLEYKGIKYDIINEPFFDI